MKICHKCFHEMPDNAKDCPWCGHAMSFYNEVDYAHALPCGSVLAGRYVVGNVLRVDGSGITYTAQEYPTETIVAVREFFPQGAAKREAPNRVIPCSEMHMEIFERGKEQFFEETGILSEFIDHPDLIRISSCFEENGTAYYVTEKIDGISLKEYLEGGKLSFYESLQILIPVMNALISMHEKGIVHRDISPAGIYINSDGSVKLLEFSAAVRIGSGQEQKLNNTVRPGFSPLEQYISLQKAGPWTDVYALAVTLYRCITGSMPPDPISRVKNDSQIPAGLAGTDLPKDAEAVLLKALALRYEDRYQSVQEFKEAIIGDRAQELLLNTQSRHRWPDVDTLKYLKRIGKESIANRMFDVHVSVSETESSLKPADSSNSFFAKFFHPRSTVVNQNIPNKEKTMTVTLQGWQTTGDAILALKEKGLLPDREYIFTDWPKAKSVMSHPVYNRWQACVCELEDKVYHVTEYSSMSMPTLYGCPNVKELEGRKLSKTVEVLDFQ